MSLNPNPSKLYFKNLNGFRFFAAALVILSHIELFKKRAGLANLWDTPFFFEAGSAGVDFFFVLSGFLITSLLLKEMDETGKVDLKKFYLRRVLRIWPLYYLVLLLCYFVIPEIQIFYFEGYSEGIFENFWEKFWLSIFFFPNAALYVLKDIPYAAPLWSVGVEEQFYLFWPIILRFFPKNAKTYLGFIILFIALKGGLVVFNKMQVIEPDSYEKIKDLVVATRMECMGIGGLGAWLIFTKSKSGRILSSNVLIVVSLITIPFIFLFANSLFELHHILFSVCFLVIILNSATNPKTFLNLESKFYLTMGNISYGLYLWHMLIVGLVLKLLLMWQPFTGEEFIFNALLYIGAFILSTFWSYFSYNYFEKSFLNLKKKFSVIVSGMEARA
jgi:peptidoglycan/LPS O-acetylase OafA/YrhL